ncbi:MAG: LPS export ABC transporter periplasmic protein LptC [Bacteroidota bacterium]|nr:LPS export ABC transporter periplasmic protein LptC [Bacteroidota bacterium]
MLDRRNYQSKNKINQSIDNLFHIFGLRILLTFSAFILVACSNDLEKIREISIQNEEVYPLETIKDCEIIYSDSAQVRVILNANEMNRYASEKNYIEFKNGLKVQFFNFEGKKQSEMQSNYAIIDEENNIMQAQQSVVLRNVEGSRLESEILNWNQEKKQIYTDDFVKIISKNEVIYGKGLVSNEDFSKYTIKQIRGTITIEN